MQGMHIRIWGMDVDQMQYHYLFTTGGKMIALAFLGMAASVLVCYLASRVGARVGRDLRGRVFRKVVGFSNNEFDHFFDCIIDYKEYQMIFSRYSFWQLWFCEWYCMHRFSRWAVFIRYFRPMFQCPGSLHLR